MGPAPMIRMVEMSVLLGIRSRGLDFGHKKRARMPRVPSAKSAGIPRARVVFRPDSAPAKPRKTAINRQIGKNLALKLRAVQSVFAFAALSYAGHASS